MIFIILKTLKILSGKTLYSLIPQINIKNKISIPKNIIGNINKTTPNPFSIPFRLLIRPYFFVFISLGVKLFIIEYEAEFNIASAYYEFPYIL